MDLSPLVSCSTLPMKSLKMTAVQMKSPLTDEQLNAKGNFVCAINEMSVSEGLRDRGTNYSTAQGFWTQKVDVADYCS